MGAQDISWLDLGLGYLLVILPIVAFRYFKVGLTKDTAVATLRMTVQLIFVGAYLEVIFRWNNGWINLLWVIAMIVIAAFTVVKRSELSRKYFLVPVLLAIATSVLLVDAYFLGVVIRLDFLLDARYFIPITGMLIGNCLSNNIVALNSYYHSLSNEQTLYRFALANGASRNEALSHFMRDSLRKALNPTIATTAVVGLISLPGMMTGQILGGSNPMVAIKYQIMIMITILVSTMLTVVLSILICNRFVFDGYGMLKKS